MTEPIYTQDQMRHIEQAALERAAKEITQWLVHSRGMSQADAKKAANVVRNAK